jgi:hypothetical protein
LRHLAGHEAQQSDLVGDVGAGHRSGASAIGDDLHAEA